MNVLEFGFFEENLRAQSQVLILEMSVRLEIWRAAFRLWHEMIGDSNMRINFSKNDIERKHEKGRVEI